jgi:hypothetical protein
MNREPVNSSNIASVGHDPHTNVMEIEFRSGKVFQYDDVNPDEHAAMLRAPSIGSHFANILRPFKNSREVK